MVKDEHNVSDVILGSKEYESTLTIDGQVWAAVGLDTGEQDQFRGSTCPQCGAWENWAGEGLHYICKECGAQYFGEKDNVSRLIGKVDSQGNLDTDSRAVSGSQMDALKGLDSPFYELLTAVDPGNREDWLIKFKRFKEGRFNLAWNWPSYFFGPWRYFLKGMSLKAVLYIVPFAFAAGLINTTAGGRSIVNMCLGFAASVFYGVMGSNDYYKFCRKYRSNIAGAKKTKKMGKINLFLFIFGPILLSVLVALSGGVGE